MTARDLPRARVYAAWASGPLAVLLGAGAHVLGGEDLPGLWVLLAVSALLSMVASMLARFRLPIWALLLVSGLIQQVLHLIFGSFSGIVGSAQTGHPHGVVIGLPPQQAAAPEAGGHHAIELMLDAHVAAALLTVIAVTQCGVLAKSLSRLRPAPTGTASPRLDRRRGVAGRR
ncbi:uncharacterized protein (DUF983 family) [Arthrobacter sp. B3I9]|uniref:hypothetical protein n=1 Tax=Arthrobacter sp. B3I9 TaxID=3042270 RepID=UPI002790BBE8|nr:hypothetical protein [Arthrobacter sp. B3I9]MDQ0849732.1 uncharacterized protein (DUF983 family) [Arthrobacter sp. B3I9]